MSYEEVFAREQPEGSPGRVFYTVRLADVGKTQIPTTAGTVRVDAVAGRILRSDVGKRIYCTDGTWQLESTRQYFERMKEETAVSTLKDAES